MNATPAAIPVRCLQPFGKQHLIHNRTMTKFLFLIPILTLGLIGCNSQTPKQTEKDMFGLFKKQDPIEKFWKWFQANEKDLRDFQKNPDKTLTQVLDSAKKIQSGLAIEF